MKAYFLNLIAKIKQYWRDHGTKLLGFGSGVISALASTGVIPAAHLKYYLAVGAVATFLRGFTNSANLEK